MRSLQKPPNYGYRAISDLPTLSRVLAIPLETLQRLAEMADSHYRLARPITKADGSSRQPFDALEPLKDIQKRIKTRILDRVIFPDYLTGSLKGRDAKRNAELHVGGAIIVCEDVANFFPSTSAKLVKEIWLRFFRFSPEVSDLLTALTTKEGALPQGAATSSHLANLAFWRFEHELYIQFRTEGIAYSRYVDDIAISSQAPLTKSELTQIIAKVYAMMFKCGFKPKRKKQEIQRGNGPMLVTKLLANTRPSIPSRSRQAIRAAVHQIERRLETDELQDFIPALNSASGRVSRLAQMHPQEGEALKKRIKAARAAFKLKTKNENPL